MIKIFYLLLIFSFFLTTTEAQLNNQFILIEDNYNNLQRGPLSSNVGAHTEYHYLPETAPKGNWSVSNDRGWWSVRENNNTRFIYQSKLDKAENTRPMIITGNEFWNDYEIETKFEPESTEYQSGFVFRYQNDLCYYFFGIQDDKVLLKIAKYQKGFRKPNETILDSKDFAWNKNKVLKVHISVSGDNIVATLDNEITLKAIDSTYRKGKIGLTAKVPTKFYSVKVTTSENSFHKFKHERSEFNKEEKELQSANPKPKLWKKIKTTGFGVGRNLRFGDLNNDGVTDVLIGQVLHHGPKDRNSELSCLTAMTFDGEILWQIGKPDQWKDKLTNDVAFQIADIDQDGQNDVIYCKDFEIIVAEGSTGKTKYKTTTPNNPGPKPTRGGNNIFDKILGDCIYICDISGKGYDSDIIIKDRYTHLWVYNAQLELLWDADCVTGHFPFAYDIDDDSKDELIMGYTLFNDDGSKLWSLDNSIKDHADGVAILKFDSYDNPKFLCAASDEGMIITDLEGNILKHHYIGHVQNPAVANFRDDLPGLETVSINFWANQGIIHYFDSNGEIYHSFEPNQYGSMCLPINWTGKSEEFFVHNPNVTEGGMFDGWGRKVVEFPDDGHPDMCNAVLDITGDCRDEVVVWNPNEIWVYTQEFNSKNGKLYKPARNPLYNQSNYQATVSLPGWSSR